MLILMLVTPEEVNLVLSTDHSELMVVVHAWVFQGSSPSTFQSHRRNSLVALKVRRCVVECLS